MASIASRVLNEAWSGDPARFDAKGRLPKVPSNVLLHKGNFADLATLG
jgi:hypothetical protein